jgi:hypothetical protein
VKSDVGSSWKGNRTGNYGSDVGAFLVDRNSLIHKFETRYQMKAIAVLGLRTQIRRTCYPWLRNTARSRF